MSSGEGGGGGGGGKGQVDGGTKSAIWIGLLAVAAFLVLIGIATSRGGG